jgi:hypothetical protein
MPKNLSIINALPIPLELIERRIYLVRGQKVMFDFDLAELYQVATKRLNEAVKRNLTRFPEDFMFQLTSDELENWRSQFATSNPALKMGLRRPPYVFTEHGVAMLSSVLNSDHAVQMNILIIRAFIQLRQLLATHKDLAVKMEKLERTQKDQGYLISLVASDIKNFGKKVDRKFKRLLKERRSKQKIGFRTEEYINKPE